MRFAANLGMLFAELPFLDRIAAAAEAGFAAVECHYPYDTPPEAVRDALSAAGLPMLGLNTPVKRMGADDTGAGAVPGLEDEADRRFDEALDYARAIGASAIHAMAGRADTRSPDARASFMRYLARCGELAQRHGIMVLIEPLNPRDSPGYFLNSSAQALDILRDLGHPSVKLQFDIYHIQIVEGDILRRFESALPLVGHVQIAGVPNRQEPDQGEIAYPWLLRECRRLGYEGWIAAEYRPSRGTRDGLGWMQAFTAGIT